MEKKLSSRGFVEVRQVPRVVELQKGLRRSMAWAFPVRQELRGHLLGTATLQ